MPPDHIHQIKMEDKENKAHDEEGDTNTESVKPSAGTKA